MATCLLGFGSNLGDREEVLRAALDEIDSLPGVHLLRESQLHRTSPIGGAADQPEFLNAAAAIETDLEPLALHAELQRIETRHGRQRGERWAARTLDIDLLLFDERVIDTEVLTVPHPRMSFRRFVLEPSAEIASEMVHPTIGWTIGRLLQHLNAASDLVAIVAPVAEVRHELVEELTARFDAQVVKPTTITAAVTAQLWPTELTAWVRLVTDTAASDPAYKAADYPKLSVLLDANSTPECAKVAAERGRGPTLQIESRDWAAAHADVFAAIEAVWPRLGPKGE